MGVGSERYWALINERVGILIQLQSADLSRARRASLRARFREVDVQLDDCAAIGVDV